jgi:formamidopyrimidine-DNA glycosylase
MRQAMPELPEVETICRGIRPHIIGRQILNITHSGKNLRSPVPMQLMQDHLLDQEIVDIRRRAKYLLIRFDNNCLLIIHLGMTGNLGIFSPETATAKHCHLRFLLSDGLELRYTDVRRFGSMHVLRANEVETMEQTFFSTTGPEPFSPLFTADYLFSSARNRSIPVKTFIMTNQVVVGVGNIYANESLFKAGIDPAKKANTLSIANWQKLILCVKEVLAHAIECGGSTISDYVNASQESGYFQINFKVYGREGEDCSKCGRIIRKSQIGGRASYYCSWCQK